VATSSVLNRAAVFLCVASVLLVVIPAAAMPLWDVDLGWILRAGADALAEQTVATRNRYSYTAPEVPWVMHEWGIGIVYAWLVAHAGVASLALVRIAAVATVTGVGLWRLGRDSRVTVIAGCLSVALLVFGGRFESPRPVGMIYALACTVASLVFEKEFTWKHGSAVVCTTWLWTQLHGSFPLALILCAAAVWLPEGERRVRVGTLLGSAAVTCINPYGMSLHALALRYATGASGDATAVVHERVLEWWPLWRDPLRTTSPAMMVCTIALTILWIFSLRDVRWRPRALVCLLLTAMAVQHNRHVGIAGMVGAILAGGPIESWLLRRHNNDKDVSQKPLWVGSMVAGVVSLIVWFALAKTRTVERWIRADQRPDAVHALVRSLPRNARVFVDFSYAGWALWAGRSDVRVFFDARNDCYPAEILRAAFDINDGLAEPTRANVTLRTWHTSHAVVRCTGRAAKYFTNWRLIERRVDVCLYAQSEEGSVDAGAEETVDTVGAGDASSGRSREP
jgi:hypothetical protein